MTNNALKAQIRLTVLSCVTKELIRIDSHCLGGGGHNDLALATRIAALTKEVVEQVLKDL